MHSDQSDPSFEGRMSDGRTAASAKVRLHFANDGLLLTGPDDPNGTVWPYESLSTAEPVNRKSNDTLISSSSIPGASLFVVGPDFAAELLKRAPHLSTGSLRWQYAKPGLIVTAALVLIVGAVWLFNLSPARTIAGWLPEAARVRLGQQVVTSMASDRRVCHTPEGRAALDKMTTRLSAVSGAERPFNVVVVDWSLLNAFAAPGSQILLTRELIKGAKSPDEVAGVLAHEMGHGLELHPETGIVRAIGMSAAIELMTGGSSGTLANAGASPAQLSYTRQAEREADAHAIRILKAAKVSPKGLGEFFERVAKLEISDAKKDAGKDDKKSKSEKDKSSAKDDAFSSYFNSEIFRTHPHSVERAELIKSQAVYDATPTLTAAEWKALQAICKKPEKPKTKPKAPAKEKDT